MPAAARGLVLAIALGACATTPPALPIPDTQSLTGQWMGRMYGPLGRTLALVAILPDGHYRGILYYEGADREFRGSIVVLTPRRARFHGLDGNGEVTLLERDGKRVLRFRTDAGSGGGEFTQISTLVPDPETGVPAAPGR